MMTAPTGQAVFDPFAPPPTTTPPQQAVSTPVVTDPVAQKPTQQVVLSAPQADGHTPTQVNVTSSDQLDQKDAQADVVGITPPPINLNDNQVATISNDTNLPLVEPLDLPSPNLVNTPPLVDLEQPDFQTPALPDSGIPSEPPVVSIDTDVSKPEDRHADQGVQLDPYQSQDFDLTEDERIALFDEVLTEAEQSASVFDQVMPAAILANDPLNPQNGSHSSARKPETVASNSAQQEAGLIGQVEFEPSSELPVEVEGFLERVEDHADKLPQEIVVADGNVQALPQSHPTQTVIVLPITEEEGQAQVKDVKLSLAWLLEWSHKIIKQFVGKVVYRHESNI